jgi:hypothetical protein
MTTEPALTAIAIGDRGAVGQIGNYIREATDRERLATAR